MFIAGCSMDPSDCATIIRINNCYIECINISDGLLFAITYAKFSLISEPNSYHQMFLKPARTPGDP